MRPTEESLEPISGRWTCGFVLFGVFVGVLHIHAQLEQMRAEPLAGIFSISNDIPAVLIETTPWLCKVLTNLWKLIPVWLPGPPLMILTEPPAVLLRILHDKNLVCPILLMVNYYGVCMILQYKRSWKSRDTASPINWALRIRHTGPPTWPSLAL